jgi:putative heme-binding domain-containing protein
VLEPKGSSFTAHFGGDFLIGNDNCFRPVDCLVGPDGALYIADWCDKRANHVDPVNNWDRTRGRVYKVQYIGGSAASPSNDWKIKVGGSTLDLNKLPSQEIVALLSHPNDWYRREANRILAERRDPAVVPDLRRIVREHKGHLALEALWTLYVSGGFDETMAAELLNHPLADVRAWTIRFLADRRAYSCKAEVSPNILAALVDLARTEQNPCVRSQLASTSKRLSGSQGLAIVRELLRRNEDVNDPHIPLLLWWAVEDKAVSDREQVLKLLDSPEAWKLPLVERYIVERLARRYTAEGTEAGYAASAWLLNHAPGDREALLLLQGMDKALEGWQLKTVPTELEMPLADLWNKYPTPLLVRCALRLGSHPAYERALQMIVDSKLDEQDRIHLIEALGQIGKPECVPALQELLAKSKSNALRLAALSALQAFPDPQVANHVLFLYPNLSGDLGTRAQTFLFSRPGSALAFLQAVDAGRIPPADVPLDQLRRAIQYDKSEIKNLVAKHWGQIGAPPPGARVARINSVLHLLGQGPGQPAAGKELFQKHCATCHTLFGEGNKIGPDLTTADRKNRSFLVTSIVDPSAIIRPEYVAHTVTTSDGRMLTGLIVDRSPTAITLVDAKTERTVLAQDKIESLDPSSVSLMPESILDPLDDQQIRNLFSYLQADSPASTPGANATRLAPSAADGPRTKDKEPGTTDKGQRTLRVCLVSGSLEYDSDASLSAFQEFLEKNYDVKCSRAFRKTDDDLPGLDNLDTCDVLLLFTRRLTISGAQLEKIKKYCQSGKPIVGVRTASHAFQNWLALDKEVFGGNYQGHYGAGLPVEVHIEAQAKDHPILAGVKPFQSAGSLYKNAGLAQDVEILLTGRIPGHSEPVAWARLRHGGRVFYTSLGHQKDFLDDNFKRLLVNALFWTAKRDVSTKE